MSSGSSGFSASTEWTRRKNMAVTRFFDRRRNNKFGSEL